MISQAFLSQETKQQQFISRPSSKSKKFLPEIIQTSSTNKLQKQQHSIFNPSKDMDSLNLHKITHYESGIEQYTSRVELQRKELIREIFRQEKKQSIPKSIINQQNEQPHRIKLKKETSPFDKQMQLKSILKRKTSNSREHTNMYDFFELENKDQKQQQQQKSNINRLKHNKQISLQPIQKEDQSPINPAKKIVSFNKQIQIKVIDPKEEKPKTNQKSFRRLYTVADLLDQQ